MATLALPAPHARPAAAPPADAPSAAAGAAPRAAAPRATRLLRALLRLTANAALLVGVLAVAGLAVGPHVAEYRTVTMLTGSMSPGIDPGDVAVVTPVPAADVRPGMVLTFQAPTEDRRTVTHRVVAVERTADGAVALRTKGDANTDVDPWLAVLDGDTAWQVRGVVPHLGTAIRALRDPVVNRVLVLGLPGLLAAWVLVSVWRPARTDAAR